MQDLLAPDLVGDETDGQGGLPDGDDDLGGAIGEGDDDGTSKVVISIGQASLTIRFVSHKTGREKILHLDRRVDAETAIESIL